MKRKWRRDLRAYWKAYGDRLRLVRLLLGISEEQAADAHGVTVQTYKKWEAGGRQRGASRARTSKNYDISIDWLFSGRANLLKKQIAFNPGGKLAILPVTDSEWRQRRRGLHNLHGGSPPTAA
jgi:transcriptional regulator with XRE-family HTH domain